MLRCGKDGSSVHKSLNHHANPVAMLKHTKHAWDSHFITIFYVGTREPKKEEMCVPVHISRPEKKDNDTSQKPSEWEFFVPAKTDLGVKLLGHKRFWYYF